MTEKIHIILPVHNRLDLTTKFINCLKVQNYINYHLILVDDGSTDGTAEMVQKEISNLTVITGKGKWWWGGGLHQGYMWIKKNKPDPNDIVLLINDDTTFEKDFLSTAQKILLNKDKTLLLAESYDQATGQYMEGGIHINWLKPPYYFKTKNNEQINCMPTRGLFFRVKDFDKIGGFFPKLLPHYGSDYEFTIRAHRKGFDLMCDPKLKLTINNETTGVHSIKEKDIFNLLKAVFSKKTPLNPIYWLSYILLSCPPLYIIPHISQNLFRLSVLLLKTIFGRSQTIL